MNRKLKKIGKGFFIGIIVAILTLATAFWVFVYLFFTGGPARTTRDIEKYEELLARPHLQTGYIVFPEKLPEGTLETDFYDYYRDTWNSPTLQTYLRCVYDDESYLAELTRLENTSKTYGNKKKMLLRDEKQKFRYPAYIAVENAAHKYEYALLTGKNEITYICTSFIYREDVEFNPDYLPYDYMTEEGRKFGSGYSIYYGSVSSDSISTYYTRDTIEEVTDAHLCMIDDSNFVVRVRLDEQGREMILECSYYTVDYKTFDEKETLYPELKGMQYLDLTADYENRSATVTYLDGAEQKTKTYPLKDHEE